MKKSLLFAFVAAGSMAFAQSNSSLLTPVLHEDTKASVAATYADGPMEYTPYVHQNGTRSVVGRNFIGTSYNLYTLLTAEQSCIDANQELGVVGFTHRQDTSFAGGSGVVQFSMTADGGTTWDPLRYDPYAGLGRYPAGVLYNPAGNTNPDNAFALMTAGIPTSGGGAQPVWGVTSFITSKLDSTGIYVSNSFMSDYDTVNWQIVRDFMEVSSDGVVHTHASAATNAGNLFNGGYIWAGEYDSDSLGWIYTPTEALSVAANNFDPNHSGFSGTAWSQDGTHGYYLINSFDSVANPNSHRQLQVFATTNSGATWTLWPAFDFSTLTRLSGSLLPPSAGGGAARPYFTSESGYDLTVDKNNNLHVVTSFRSAFSYDPDSLGFVYGPEIIADFFTTGAGTWDATVIGQCQTLVQDATSTIPTFGNDHRLQTGRSADGSIVYAMWMDTDTVKFPGTVENEFPDIYAWAMNVDDQLNTSAVNFTDGTAFDGANTWMYVSGNGLDNVGGGIVMPASVSVQGASDLDPPAHYHVSDLVFDSDAFSYNLDGQNTIGLLEENVNEIRMFPNPATDMVNISIELNDASNTSLSVINMVGQVVIANDYGMLNGSNRLEMNVSSLPAGMYIVEINAGASSQTERLIVK